MSNTIPEKALEPHQRKALLEARNGSLVHKISDVGHIRLPFDAFMLRKTDAFVVACFKRHGFALVVPVEDWKGIRYTSGAYKYKIDL